MFLKLVLEVLFSVRSQISIQLTHFHLNILGSVTEIATWVDREVIEPLQEEGKEGLGVGRRGEAKSDWAGQEDGEGGENS